MGIRLARPGDAPQVAGIYKQYVDGSCYSFETKAPSSEEMEARMRAILDFFPYLVYEDARGIKGYAYAHRFHEREAYRWVCETSIYTAPGSARAGIGRSLYSTLLDALKRQGFTKAMAILGCPNEASEAFHAAMGFGLLATFPEMGFKLGGWHDVKYYCLDLAEARDDMPEPIPFPALGFSIE